MTNIHFVFFLFLAFPAIGQENTQKPPPANWHLLDWEEDGFPGISLEKAYEELLAQKEGAQKVIVAVIDDGIDYHHRELQGMIWHNKKEVPNNQLDDDHNGYVDDEYGWNFIGDMEMETFESFREYVRLKPIFSDSDMTNEKQLTQDSLRSYWEKIVQKKEQELGQLQQFRNFLEWSASLRTYWQEKLDTSTVYWKNIKQLSYDEPLDSNTISFNNLMLGNASVSEKTIDELIGFFSARTKELDAFIAFLNQDDPAFYRTNMLNDNPFENVSKAYGNNKTLPQANHGTMVAGIIAALRNNEILPQGICAAVEIMPIRIFIHPFMDEWDKDVANAIRYAVDNGAKVINISFGKKTSPQKYFVDEAIRYAEEKGVLLVHAAGNYQTNIDSTAAYPSPYYLNQERAGNLLTVGASIYDSSLVSSISNYGADVVDIFAPGVRIYSLQGNDGESYESGTSCASPIVAGVAALIWSYYPELTYQQIKQCIERSAVPLDMEVKLPGSNTSGSFRSLSRTGGIVNAYRALQLAEAMGK